MSGTEVWTSDGEELTEDELDDATQEFLEGIYDDVDVCGYPMSAARVLREADPVAFRQEVLNYADAMIRDGDWFDHKPDPACSECGERYDEEKGDGYAGMCPECADASEPEGDADSTD